MKEQREKKRLERQMQSNNEDKFSPEIEDVLENLKNKKMAVPKRTEKGKEFNRTQQYSTEPTTEPQTQSKLETIPESNIVRPKSRAYDSKDDSKTGIQSKIPMMGKREGRKAVVNRSMPR